MNPTLRFLADTAERAVKTFVQAFVGYWLMFNDAQADTAFTWNNLKAALTIAALSVLTSLASKFRGNPDSASVLPPEAQPPAPQPADPTLKPEDAAPEPVRVGLTGDEQLLEQLRRLVVPIAAPPVPAPPLAPPPVRTPLGLLDPAFVGGREQRRDA